MRFDKYYLLLSQVFLAFANWGLLAIIARSYNPETTGEYGLVLAIINPVFLLFSFQLRNHYLSHPESRNNFFVYLRLRLFSLLPMLLIATSVHFYFQLSHGLFFSLLLLKCSEVLFELPFMVDHQQEHLKKAAFNHFIRTFLIYTPLIAAILFGSNLFRAIILGAFIGLLIFGQYLMSVLKSLPKKTANKELKELFKEALPLGIAAAIISLNVSLPRFFLSQLINKEAVATFTIIFTFYSLWQLIFNSYLNAQLPSFKKTPFLKKTFAPISALAIFCLVFLVYGNEVYAMLFGPKYQGLAELNHLLFISIFLSFINSYLYYSFLALNNYHAHLRINSFSILINLIFLYPLIMSYGIKGAMLAWILSQLTQGLFYLLAQRRS